MNTIGKKLNHIRFARSLPD